MINGFLLQITNRSSDWETVALFKKGESNPHVDIKTYQTDFDIHSLLFMANSQGFVGGGIKSENGFIEKVTIYTPNAVSKIEFKTFCDLPCVFIDGFANYLSVEVPPLKTGFFQLLPLSEK